MPILCRISQIEAKGIEGYYDTNPLGDNNIMAKDEHQSLYQTRYKTTKNNITTSPYVMLFFSCGKIVAFDLFTNHLPKRTR